MRFYQEQNNPYTSQFVPLPLDFMYSQVQKADAERKQNDALLATTEFKVDANRQHAGGVNAFINEYYKEVQGLTDESNSQFSNAGFDNKVIRLKNKFNNDPRKQILEQGVAAEKMNDEYVKSLGDKYHVQNNDYALDEMYGQKKYGLDKEGKVQFTPVKFNQGNPYIDISKELLDVGTANKGNLTEEIGQSIGAYITIKKEGTNNVIYSTDKNNHTVKLPRLSMIAMSVLAEPKNQEQINKDIGLYVSQGKIKTKEEYDSYKNALEENYVNEFVNTFLHETKDLSIKDNSIYTWGVDRAERLQKEKQMNSLYTLALPGNTETDKSSSYHINKPSNTGNKVVDFITNTFLGWGQDKVFKEESNKIMYDDKGNLRSPTEIKQSLAIVDKNINTKYHSDAFNIGNKLFGFITGFGLGNKGLIPVSGIYDADTLTHNMQANVRRAMLEDPMLNLKAPGYAYVDYKMQTDFPEYNSMSDLEKGEFINKKRDAWTNIPRKIEYEFPTDVNEQKKLYQTWFGAGADNGKISVDNISGRILDTKIIDASDPTKLLDPQEVFKSKKGSTATFNGTLKNEYNDIAPKAIVIQIDGKTYFANNTLEASNKMNLIDWGLAVPTTTFNGQGAAFPITNIDGNKIIARPYKGTVDEGIDGNYNVELGYYDNKTKDIRIVNTIKGKNYEDAKDRTKVYLGLENK